MAIQVTSAGKEFTPVTEGIHNIVLASIIDLGTVQTSFGLKEQVMFIYVTDEMDEEGEPKLLIKTFTKSLHEKATLRKEVKALIRKEPEETMDIEPLVGTQAVVVVTHVEAKNGKVYANITGHMRPNGKSVGIPSDWAVPEGLLKKKGTAGKPISDEDVPF